jgi:ribokinase
MRPAVVIVGSLNMDFVVRVGHLPVPGETVLGSGFQTIPGGKGANQACAAGRLARNLTVRMVGRVGYDLFADQLKASLAAAGVDVSHVHASRSHPTGVALICVDQASQNSIVVASGANSALLGADVPGFRPAFRDAAIALFQFETPIDTVTAALRLARSSGALTVLDPAPARPLPVDLSALVDILTPNESEACILLGRAAARITPDEAPAVALALRATGIPAVILKLADEGCFYAAEGKALHVPGFRVTAVDTTAAGDTFNGALAVSLAENEPIDRALRFANAAAALSVTRAGAQASMPSREEVDRFLELNA